MSDVTCPTCEGTGIKVLAAPSLGNMGDLDSCPDCKGTGTAAAPAVEGWVWCLFGAANGTHEARPVRKNHEGGYVSDGPCPGPHRTLLLGPEVEA